MKEAPWLLILDNIEDRELLERCWPVSTAGNVITTSRRPDVGFYMDRGLEILPFDNVEGGTALLHFMHPAHQPSENVDEFQKAVELSRLLGGHTLALVQTAFWMGRSRISISEMLKLYRKQSKRLLSASDKQVSYYNHKLDTVWLMSFVSLTPRSIEFLGILSVLDPDNIALELLCRCEEGLPFFCDDIFG